MIRIATILMKPRSGMTSAAVALATGMRAAGDRPCLIVPESEQIATLRKTICPASTGVGILGADCLRDMAFAMAEHVLIFDDALRCADIWRGHGEGELLTCLKARVSPVAPDATRAWFFQYTL